MLMGWVKNLCPRLEGKAGNMALLQKGKNKVNPEKKKKASRVTRMVVIPDCNIMQAMINKLTSYTMYLLVLSLCNTISMIIHPK